MPSKMRAMTPRRIATRVLLLTLSAGTLLGCKSEQEKKCEQLVKSSEVTLLSMNPTQKDSVTRTVEELKKTLLACEAAGSADVAEIKVGLQNVERHLSRLEKGEIKAPPPPPGVVELADLEKKGDPACPKGQGYQHPVLNKLIKCSGPTMVERNYKQVGEYFEKHRIQAAVKDAMIRGEQSGITYTYMFDKVGSEQSAYCLTIDAPKDKKKEELISFATNIEVDKIKVEQGIVLAGQKVPVAVTENDSGINIVIGVCDGPAPLIAPAAASDSAAAPNANAAPN